jgi:hypothetical protein
MLPQYSACVLIYKVRYMMCSAAAACGAAAARAMCCPVTDSAVAQLLLLQVAYHASRALLQYVRAHLVSHMTSLQRRLRDAQVKNVLACLQHLYNTCAPFVQHIAMSWHPDPSEATWVKLGRGGGVEAQGRHKRLNI